MFSIDIYINKEGEVIESKVNIKKSSDLSNKLKQELLKIVKESKFNTDKNSIKKQKGNITYLYKNKH